MPSKTDDYYFEDDMQSFLYCSNQIFTDWVEKLFSGALISSLLVFFNADQLLYWILVSLMLADFACGIIIGITTDEGWNFDKIRRGIAKILASHIYVALAGVTTLILKSLGWDTEFSPINIMMGYLSFNEINSIIRNLDRLGFKTPPLLKLLITKSNRKIQKTVENIVEDEEIKKDK